MGSHVGPLRRCQQQPPPHPRTATTSTKSLTICKRSVTSVSITAYYSYPCLYFYTSSTRECTVLSVRRLQFRAKSLAVTRTTCVNSRCGSSARRLSALQTCVKRKAFNWRCLEPRPLVAVLAPGVGVSTGARSCARAHVVTHMPIDKCTKALVHRLSAPPQPARRLQTLWRAWWCHRYV